MEGTAYAKVQRRALELESRLAVPSRAKGTQEGWWVMEADAGP